MPIEPGTKLGHYEIVAPLGAGGMGEVYRARDMRLDRTVAVKVLPQHLSDNVELRQRFEQEARAVSSLNHPNICTLHDIGRENGIDFMVMECIEGETLAERLQRGPLPLDEALRCAVAIGDALDKAHRQRIVHRDLKPGNVMLTKSGPKLLDFGLATRLRQGYGEARDNDSSLPTEQKPLTEKGAILGTFQYMAPEQLEGGETDARTDIFAFGVLLYEIVTGQKAFSGKSQASLISAILSSEPRPISDLRPATPKSIDRMVRGCLAKDPDDRWQSARDIVLQIESLGGEDETTATSAPTSRTRERILWAALVLAGVGIVGTWGKSTTPPRAETTRAVIPLPKGDQLLGGSSILGFASSVDVSPDGRTIAYVAENTGESQLYLRRLDELEATPVPGAGRAVAPFFSPDGRWVGFDAEGDLRKTTVEGTTITDIAERAARLAGSSWGDNGNIVIGGPQLTRVSESDGVPHELGKPIAGQFVWPQVLPGGQHLLATTVGTKERSTIAIVSMESGEVRPLLEGYAGARYASSGHLIVGDQDTQSLFAVVFDPDTLELRGAPTPVVDDVYFSPRSGMPHFAVSDSGVLVYVPGGSGGAALVWVDREGDVIEPLGLAPGAYSHLRLSPDEQRVAVDNYTGGYRDIWVYQLERGTRIRLTSGDQASNPIWTPDGARVTFSSLGDYLERDWPIHWRVADGSADGEVLLAGKQRNRYPMSWSPDGTTLAYAENQTTPGERDMFILTLGEQPRPLLATSFNERSPVFSPDGRFLAYVSDESGRSEVYVLPYPAEDQKWPISTDGGAEPMWSRDGRELFYRNGYKMMVVPVETGAAFRAQRPRQLFEGRYYADASGHPNYDVSTDGQRFLMIQETEDERTQLNVVFNWFEELKRLVPTEN